jgi:hypothetical protein
MIFEDDSFETTAKKNRERFLLDEKAFEEWWEKEGKHKLPIKSSARVAWLSGRCVTKEGKNNDCR